MRKRRFKQVIAMFMAFTMVFGMNTMAFAAEPRNEATIYETNPGGENEPNGPTDVDEGLVNDGIGGGESSHGTIAGSINEEVFHVSVPTSGNQAFRFIMDPQLLIQRSNRAAYPDSKYVFPEGLNHTMFFRSSSDNAGTSKDKWALSPSSDSVRMINYSSVSVDVTLTAKLTPATSNKITVSSGNKEFGGDNNNDIWMQVVSFNVAGNTVDDTGATRSVDRSQGGKETKLGEEYVLDEDGTEIDYQIKVAASANESKTGAMDGMYYVSTNSVMPDRNWNDEYATTPPAGYDEDDFDSTNPKVTVSSETLYTLKLKESCMPSANKLNPDNAFEEFKFYLTGSANMAPNWKDFTSSDVPTLDLIWNIKPISKYEYKSVSLTSARVITIKGVDESDITGITVGFADGSVAYNIIGNHSAKTTSGEDIIYTLESAWATDPALTGKNVVAVVTLEGGKKITSNAVILSTT